MGNAWFTTKPLKPLFDQYCGRNCRFSRFKNQFWKFNFIVSETEMWKVTFLGKPGIKNDKFSKGRFWISQRQSC